MFIFVLFVSAIFLASCAAFFSIYGLAQIFSGIFLQVVIMGSALEVGKLVAASFAYRYWNQIGKIMKTYLVLAILTLMFITSAGIFGLLSSGFQQNVLPLEEMKSQIAFFAARKEEIDKLKLELVTRVATLDIQVSEIPATHSTNRRRMRESQQKERDRINIDLERYSIEFQKNTDAQYEIKQKMVQQKVHTGPIIFIAQALNKDIDDAVKYMIFLIIFAFDPLAVVLIIGANIAILRRQGFMGEPLSVLGFNIGEDQAEHHEMTTEESTYYDALGKQMGTEMAKRIGDLPTQDINYDKLSDTIATKLDIKTIEVSQDVDYDEIATRVAKLISEPGERIVEREHKPEIDKKREIKQQIRNPQLAGRAIERNE